MKCCSFGAIAGYYIQQDKEIMNYKGPTACVLYALAFITTITLTVQYIPYIVFGLSVCFWVWYIAHLIWEALNGGIRD